MLISTDNGAKGFNLEEASFVIHYDLPYNTLKMEQRIDRCHRLGQENDVLSLAFLNQHNLSDVRKLELASKRTLVSDGVFGLTDSVLGGFAGNLEDGFQSAAAQLRTRTQVEADFQQVLTLHEEENRKAVSAAEEVLFTTFTRELARRVNLSPRYVSKRAEELNRALWRLAKTFFLRYNEINTDCVFVIDEETKTVTATEYQELPMLFYYWSGSRNRPYRSQKRYGMGGEFKPRAGRITFSSVIGQGILHELECANFGTLTVEGNVEPCQFGLYTVTLTGGSVRREVPVGALLEREAEKLSPAQAEELERIKLRCNGQKAALARKLDGLEVRVKALEAEREAVTGDRLKRLALEKEATKLKRELIRGRENRFFDAMRLDVEKIAIQKLIPVLKVVSVEVSDSDIVDHSYIQFDNLITVEEHFTVDSFINSIETYIKTIGNTETYKKAVQLVLENISESVIRKISIDKIVFPGFKLCGHDVSAITCAGETKYKSIGSLLMPGERLHIMVNIYYDHPLCKTFWEFNSRNSVGEFNMCIFATNTSMMDIEFQEKILISKGSGLKENIMYSENKEDSINA